jgi:hypothetical protein
MSKKPFRLEQRVYAQAPDMKPRGFWYGIDHAWREWVLGEMPHWIGEHYYSVDVGPSNILFIQDRNQIREFHREHCTGYLVDWPRVAKEYDGIEISPYQWEFRHEMLWYYGWDVASGCIWNLHHVKLGAPSKISEPAP